MAPVTRVEPIDRDVQLVISNLLSPKAQSRMAAQAARGILAEAQEVNKRAFGAVPPHKTAVDGRLEAPLEAVKPDGGTIVFTFDLPMAIILAIWQLLRDLSPVGGPPEPTYRDSHKLFVDGIEVSSKATIPPGREYVFLNPVPYARKIEIGKMRMRVPGSDRVYQRAEQRAKRWLSKSARVKFTYRATQGGHRSPALIISLR